MSQLFLLTIAMLICGSQARNREDAFQDGENGEVDGCLPGDERREINRTGGHRPAVSKMMEVRISTAFLRKV